MSQVVTKRIYVLSEEEAKYLEKTLKEINQTLKQIIVDLKEFKKFLRARKVRRK